MATEGKERDKGAAVDPAPDSSRVPDFAEAMRLNPLTANSAAAMAAATAIGFGLASQMASAFFGVVQGAMEAANRRDASTSQAGAPVAADEASPAETLVAAGAAAVADPAPVAETPKAAPVRRASVGKAAAQAEAKRPSAPAKPKVAKASAATDDLKRISGIGPKLEGILNGMGITSVAQVAGWKDKDIARFEKDLGMEGRVGRDDWVGQAKALMK